MAEPHDLDAPDAALVSAIADDEHAPHDLASLAAETGAGETLLESLERAGLLLAHHVDEDGVPRYSAADAAAVHAGLALLDAGLPLGELLDLARRTDAAVTEIAEHAVEAFLRFVRDPVRGTSLSDEEAADRLVTAYQRCCPPPSGWSPTTCAAACSPSPASGSPRSWRRTSRPRERARDPAGDDPAPRRRPAAAGAHPPGDALAFVRSGEGLVGWGEALRLRPGPGPDRIVRADQALREVDAEVDDPVDLPGSGLVAIGSFSFASTSADSALVVPRVVVGRRDGRTFLTRIDPVTDPPHPPPSRPPPRPRR
jgi:hypothetical protein